MSANEESVFAEALDIDDPRGRAAFLDQACAGDPALRRSVESLLSAYGAGQFLEAPAPALADTVDAPTTLDEHPGSVLGSYKLLEQIGEGGFGVVFMAEQTQPVRRRVALKVLKPGMDSRQVVARFEAERQALALMDHPHIARVFDGGTTAAGRPYFVMELVRGVPLTDFCDQNHLTVRRRLELFVTVCQAVQHAHQKGIIHRDLKPSNVLVTLHDDKPVAKVIDFGIAKATGQQLTDKTLFTNFAQMVGTPLYMSPEQAQLSGLDIDTRTDIYSLGVMLYELLTGTTPFTPERLKQAGYEGMRRIIREEEPPRPSTRLSTLGPAAATLSMLRQSDPKRLSRQFRSELDWVVMRCLEKDRNRRYETANALALDVRRYLDDEPVQACPPSVGYRFRKFARRYKTALGILALVIAVLTASAAGLVWAWRETLDALHQMEQARDREHEERERSQVALAAKTVALARQAWLTDDLAAARQLLADCPPAYRDRDWHDLTRACNSNLAVLGPSKGYFGRLAWSREGRWLAVAAQLNPVAGDYAVQVFDTTGGREPLTLRGPARPVGDVALTSDGRCVSVAYGTSVLLVGRAYSSSAPFQTKTWDLETGKELHSFSAPFVSCLALSPDGRYVATANYPGVKVVEIATGRELPALPVPYPADLVFDPTSRLLVVTGHVVEGREAIHVADLVTYKSVSKPLPYTIDNRCRPALSPDGRRLATAVFDRTNKTALVRVWDLGSGREVASLQGHSQYVRGLAFSPDGRHLASGSLDKSVCVWDLETGKEVLRLRGHTAPVNAVAFCPDRVRLASTSDDGTVRLWNVGE
jgi:serine/threonine protein kinase